MIGPRLKTNRCISLAPVHPLFCQSLIVMVIQLWFEWTPDYLKCPNPKPTGVILLADKSKSPFVKHQTELGKCGMCVAWCCLAIWLGHRNHREDEIHTHKEPILFINTCTRTHWHLWKNIINCECRLVVTAKWSLWNKHSRWLFVYISMSLWE
jgi:hypothetical protein